MEKHLREILDEFGTWNGRGSDAAGSDRAGEKGREKKGVRPEGGEGRCGRGRRREGDRRFFLPFFSSERRNLTTFIRGPLSPPLWGQERKKLLEWDRPRRGQELGRKTRNWPAAVERGKRDIKQAEEKSGVLFAAFGLRGFVGLWGVGREASLCLLPSFPPFPFSS